MIILGGFTIGVQDTSASSNFAFYSQEVCIQNTNEYELRTLTLNLVVEISAFRMSGSYFVLDEEPENTFLKDKKGQIFKHV